MKNSSMLAGLVIGALSIGQASAGPIFLTGHDPDFHSQPGAGSGDALLLAGLEFVTGSTATLGTGDRFLWVESRPTSVPGGHLRGENGLNAIGLTLGTHYDRANAAEFATVDLSAYTAIAIASSFGGLLTRAELDALIARASDIEDFINGGGGLFASAECDDCGADLLGADPDLFGYLPVTVTSIGASAPFTVTAFGASLGLTDADLNDPTHNSFGLVGGLNVVDTDSAGNATTLAGIVNIEDDVFIPVPVPAPGTLSLLAAALLAMAGVARLRRAT